MLKRVLILLVSCLFLPTTAASASSDQDNVVVILTGGLTWNRLDAENYPHLEQLATNGTVANMAPMPLSGVSCPFDSWLEISAGRQVYPSAQSMITCPQPKVNAGHQITFWGQSLQALAIDPTLTLERTAGAAPGTFGDSVSDVSSQAVGTGGAYVLAPQSGIVPENYVEAPSDNTELASIVSQSASDNALTVVDADTHSYKNDLQRESSQRKAENQTRLAQGLPPLPDPNRAPDDETEEPPVIEETPEPEFPEEGMSFEDAIQSLETAQTEESRENYEDSRDAMREELTEDNAARVDTVLGEVPEGTQVLVASLTDFGNDRALQIAISGTVGDQGEGALGTSGTTRQTGLIHETDIAPTILDMLGLDSTDVTGAPITSNSDSATLAERTTVLSDNAVHSSEMLANRGLFLRFVTNTAIGFFLLSLVLFMQPVYRRFPLRRVWSWLGYTLASVPVSSLLINLLSWWNTSNPPLALIGGSWLLAGGIGLICLNLQKLRSTAPLLAISGLTAGVLLLDTATGSHLMADSPMGFNILTAARFYGLGNEAYSLLATGALVILSFLGVWISGRTSARISGRNWALAVIGFLGLIVAAIDAMPSMGADFGGALSFLPALIVLMMLIGKIRVSWGKALGIVGITGLLAAGLAFVDWLRPAAERTHLGRFFDSVLQGELWDILIRKGGTNLRLLFSSTHRWVTLAALLLVLLVLLQILRKHAVMDAGEPIDKGWKPTWWNHIRMSYLSAWGWLAPTEISGHAPAALKPALISIAVCTTLAFALNDSGIVIPGMAAILLLPLLVGFVQGEQDSSSSQKQNSPSEPEVTQEPKLASGAPRR